MSQASLAGFQLATDRQSVKAASHVLDLPRCPYFLASQTVAE